MTAWPKKTRPNATAKIPYGYVVDEDDPLVLHPDLNTIGYLEKALEFLDNGNSYRETARWLSEQSGHDISHQGLGNIWKRTQTLRQKSKRRYVRP